MLDVERIIQEMADRKRSYKIRVHNDGAVLFDMGPRGFRPRLFDRLYTFDRPGNLTKKTWAWAPSLSR